MSLAMKHINEEFELTLQKRFCCLMGIGELMSILVSGEVQERFEARVGQFSVIKRILIRGMVKCSIKPCNAVAL